MNDDRIEDILEGMGMEEVPADILKIAEETSNEFSKSLKEPPKTHLLELIMRSRTMKLAAAAVIMIAALLGIYIFDGSGVALADVLAKVEQARAFMYKMNMETTGSVIPGHMRQMRHTVTVSKDYGMKMEATTIDPNTGEETGHTAYILLDEKAAITIIHDKKKYMRTEFDNDWLDKMKQQNNDPREMIKQIMACKYTELGRSVIDGVKVDGFRTTDPSVVGGMAENVTLTLWVDAEKWLPVRSEMEFKMGDKMQVKGVVSEFNWDLPVTADDFKPVIPEDYEPMAKGGMQMPKISEEGAIEGLKLFAELSGAYPKKMNMLDFAAEVAALADSQALKDRVAKLKEEMTRNGELDKDEFIMKSTQITMPVQSPVIFYMMLTQDKKEPVYYGETVGPGDIEAVLMRWKISDDQYRVIFGDLSALTVTAEELNELEE